jgi:hypothetical protein
MGAATASAVEPLASAVGDRPSIGDNRGNRQSGLAMPASTGNLRIRVVPPHPTQDSKQRRERDLLPMLRPGPGGGGEPGRRRAAPTPARAPPPPARTVRFSYHCRSPRESVPGRAQCGLAGRMGPRSSMNQLIVSVKLLHATQPGEPARPGEPALGRAAIGPGRVYS